jgi:hypothetical protein
VVGIIFANASPDGTRTCYQIMGTWLMHYRIYLLCRVSRHSAKALPSVALGKERSAKNLWAKRSLPSAFCRALGKEKHSTKCKLEKIQKKKQEKKFIGEACTASY